MDFHNKNILLILHQGSLGGAERQGLSLGKILAENHGCTIYLLLTFSAKVSEDFETYAKSCHVKKIFHFGAPYLVVRKEFSYKNLKRLVWSTKYILRMRKGLKPYKLDFIFPFLNFPSKVAFYLYKVLPSVKFTFWHQLGLDTFKDDVFEKYAANHIPCIIANAPNGITLFKDAHPLSKRPSYVLPQFLAFEPVFMEHNALLKKYELPENALCIGMVAHYRPEKLHYLLLNAFIELLETHENIHLIFLGNKYNSEITERQFQALQLIVTENKLEKNVHILSHKPVKEVLNLMDMGVLVSEIEGTPNAVMEYMAYGLPVVATAHSGCELLLKNSDFLIKNDQKDLKNALSTFINSAKLRQTEGDKNLALIKEYTPENYLSKLKTIMSKTF